MYVHSTPSFGPTVYVQPQRTLQPPHLPPRNRTYYIKPHPTQFPIHNSRNQTQHQQLNLSPFLPIYGPVVQVEASSKTPEHMHIQKIPRKGEATKSNSNWPPPFSNPYPPDTNMGRIHVDESKREPTFDDVEEVTPEIHSRAKVWKTSNFCDEDQFECGVRDCIPLNWVCNGKQVIRQFYNLSQMLLILRVSDVLTPSFTFNVLEVEIVKLIFDVVLLF